MWSCVVIALLSATIVLLVRGPPVGVYRNTIVLCMLPEHQGHVGRYHDTDIIGEGLRVIRLQ